MARRRSMTRNQNHDDEEASSSVKSPKSCAPWSYLDHNLLFLVMMRLGFVEFPSFCGVCKSYAPWSDLNHDVLNIIIMQLEVVDFLSFSGVYKSWRSFTHSYENMFMASKPPMSISFSTDSNEKACYLEDFEGTKFKTIIPHSAVGTCVGLTCGYLIFFEKSTLDFWLVNPITRHQLHFPDSPFDYHHSKLSGRAILVFSPSMSGWVFVVLRRYSMEIWFSIAGKGAWNRFSHSFNVADLYAFKGKIYTVSYTPAYYFCELRLSPEPNLTLLKIKMPPDLFLRSGFVSSSEKLFAIYRHLNGTISLHEVDLVEMKWVRACEKTIREYAFFRSDMNHGVVVKP